MKSSEIMKSQSLNKNTASYNPISYTSIFNFPRVRLHWFRGWVGSLKLIGIFRAVNPRQPLFDSRGGEPWRRGGFEVKERKGKEKKRMENGKEMEWR